MKYTVTVKYQLPTDKRASSFTLDCEAQNAAEALVSTADIFRHKYADTIVSVSVAPCGK